MAEIWIALNSLPPVGLECTVEDPAVWTDPMGEFALPCTVRTPFTAQVTLLPQAEGCLARGRMTGSISLPCDRCTEDAIIEIDQRFDSFEPFPIAQDEPASGQLTADDDLPDLDNETDEMVMRLGEGGAELNLAALLWAEFSLALPVHPVCRPDCRGLCPTCGQNLNDGPCACAPEQGDPRLAVLRGLKIDRA